jgi:uncharacterized protein YigE (DUF2233 family)
MTSVVYGFRPESGWPGVLFQVFLQGTFISTWQQQKELCFWIHFKGQGVPATFHELESDISLPEVGNRRYVLQCIVPPCQYHQDCCPVTLSVHHIGEKSIADGLFVGNFQYRPNGISICPAC